MLRLSPLLLLLLPPACASPAASPEAGAPAAETAQADPDAVVCRSVAVTGQRRKERVCTTAREQALREQRNQRQMEEVQRPHANPVTPRP